MAKIIGLPKLSPTMEEGTLVHWAKKEGDAISVDDLLAEVETDKATMEFRSFDNGVLLKLLVQEGATLAPDQPVAIIGNEGEDISGLLKDVGSRKSGNGQKTQAPAQGKGQQEEAPSQTQAQTPIKPEKPAAPSKAQAAAAPAKAPREHKPSGGRVRATPLVRKLARERNVELEGVVGSGPKGRIVLKDLESGLKGRASTSRQQFEAQAERSVPLSSMRRTIARRLTESKQNIPHFYLTIDVDAEPIWQARQQINAELEERGDKVSINDLVIRASALALRKVPEANASFMGDSITYHGRVDISVAIAIPDGLVTPVIRSADQKDVVTISQEVKEYAQRAKDKRLTPEEMSNGTFSISNLGMYGIEDFSAVINPPEGAILAVGSVREEVVAVEGQIKAGRRMRVTLSCDHRVIDGAVGATWLKALRHYLENPVTLFL